MKQIVSMLNETVVYCRYNVELLGGNKMAITHATDQTFANET